MKRVVALTLLCLCLCGSRTGAFISEPSRLIDCPTAGVVPRGSFDTAAFMFHGGGLICKFDIGLITNFSLGVSYGAMNVIGNGEVDWNKRAGVTLKLRIINESMAWPALVVGFDSQGYGAYHRSLDRFGIKSKGLYVVVSKSIGILSGFGVHGGANRSFEGSDDDEDISFFTGFDFALTDQLALLGEYDLGLNDNRENDSFGRGEGYLNAGIRLALSEQFFVEFDMKDLLENREDPERLNREIRIVYREYF